jgi:hypothetical protein
MRAWPAGVALIAVLHAGVAGAEEPAAPGAGAVEPPVQQVPRPEGRTLNGHVFMPSTSVPGALVTTSFASSLLLGMGSTSGSFQVGDRSFNGTYEYAGIGANLGYEYAFGRNFSARVQLQDIIYSGINGESAIAVGTQFQVGGTVGVTASMPVGEALRVGVLLDAGYVPGLALTIASGLRAIEERCQSGSCTVGNGDIFGTRNAVTIQPAVAASWAPSRALGVTGNLAYVHVSQQTGFDTTVQGDAIALAGAVDYDFRAVGGPPVGLMLQASWTAPIGGDTAALRHVTDLGGGIFYTGRDNLALGLQLVARRFAVQPDLDVSWSTFISTIGLRYYW